MIASCFAQSGIDFETCLLPLTSNSSKQRLSLAPLAASAHPDRFTSSLEYIVVLLKYTLPTCLRGRIQDQFLFCPVFPTLFWGIFRKSHQHPSTLVGVPFDSSVDTYVLSSLDALCTVVTSQASIRNQSPFHFDILICRRLPVIQTRSIFLGHTAVGCHHNGE